MKNKKAWYSSLLAVILVFGIVLSSGCSKEKPDTDNVTESPSAEVNTTIKSEESSDLSETKEDEDNNVSEKETSEDSEKEEEEKNTSENEKNTTEKTDKPVSNTPDTVEEVVALFNKSANKIKTDATKVVKNFERRIVNEDKTVIPAGLESTAESMIKSLMGDDTKPTTFATKEEIKENFIVPQQSYVSKLSPDYVVKAECKEKGNTYEIYLKLKDHKNPTAGIGVGAVCDVIETHEIAQKASFIKEFSTTYYSCEIKATMDKATGKITHIVYTTPLVMNMTVNLLGTHSGSIGFTFIKDYTVTYWFMWFIEQKRHQIFKKSDVFLF